MCLSSTSLRRRVPIKGPKAGRFGSQLPMLMAVEAVLASDHDPPVVDPGLAEGITHTVIPGDASGYTWQQRKQIPDKQKMTGGGFLRHEA